MRAGIVSLLFTLLCVQLVLAQGTCPDLVETALAQASDACVDLGRNQACYGNINLEAQARDGVSDFTFTQQGDIASLVDIQHLTLDAMDLTQDTWGVALLKLQANLPDTNPGQNVTMVLFGNVELEVAEVSVSAANNANVRATPSTEAAIAGTISAGESVRADGRLEDGSWLRVSLPDGVAGWVRIDLVTTTGEISALPVVTADDAPFAPLQAFYFATAIGDAPCAEAPDSGILVQSPQGAGEIELTANGVNITLGSTAYLQAQAGIGGNDGVMTVSVVEGQGIVEAAGVNVTIPAGMQATIPLDENGIANGAPEGPTPYDGAALAALPITLLPETITIAESSVAEATEEAIDVANTGTYTAADLALGDWTAVVNVQFIDCGDSTGDYTFEYTFSHNSDTWGLNIDPPLHSSTDEARERADGVLDVMLYLLGDATRMVDAPYWTITILSPTSATGTTSGFFPDSLTCTIPMLVTLTGEGSEATPEANAEATPEASTQNSTTASAGTFTRRDLVQGEWTETMTIDPGSCESDATNVQLYVIFERRSGFHVREDQSGPGWSIDVVDDSLSHVSGLLLYPSSIVNIALDYSTNGTPDITEDFDLTIISPESLTLHYTISGYLGCGTMTADITMVAGHNEVNVGNYTVDDLISGNWTAEVTVDESCSGGSVTTHSYSLVNSTGDFQILDELGNGLADLVIEAYLYFTLYDPDPSHTVNIASPTSLAGQMTVPTSCAAITIVMTADQ